MCVFIPIRLSLFCVLVCTPVAWIVQFNRESLEGHLYMFRTGRSRLGL